MKVDASRVQIVDRAMMAHRLVVRTAILPSAALILVVSMSTGHTRVPATHRLEATPATIAYGYYWADAKPVLRIASGDIIDVDTLLTNTPAGLQKAGVKPADIQESLKAIVTEVTGDRRGPGGHILTGRCTSKAQSRATCWK